MRWAQRRSGNYWKKWGKKWRYTVSKARQSGGRVAFRRSRGRLKCRQPPSRPPITATFSRVVPTRSQKCTFSNTIRICSKTCQLGMMLRRKCRQTEMKRWSACRLPCRNHLMGSRTATSRWRSITWNQISKAMGRLMKPWWCRRRARTQQRTSCNHKWRKMKRICGEALRNRVEINMIPKSICSALRRQIRVQEDHTSRETFFRKLRCPQSIKWTSKSNCRRSRCRIVARWVQSRRYPFTTTSKAWSQRRGISTMV